MKEKIHILVVEDEVIIAKDICDQLDSLGYHVCGQARSHDEALSEAEKKQPDLVLMDIQIKGPKDGIETASELIKKFEIPIVFLTAHSDEHTLTRAKAIGPYGYILKPFNEALLHTAIQVALGKHELSIQLKEVNKSLEAYNHSVSHDIKTPLRHINFYLEVLKESLGENIQKNALDAIEKIALSVKNAYKITDSLLRLSKTSQKDLNLELVPIEKIVKKIIKQFDENNAGHTICFDVKPLPDVIGDHDLLEHVFTNIINNAIKYSTHTENPIIEIGFIKNSLNEGNYYIKDNGVGFNMQYYEKLFTPFTRLHSQEYDGSGLGLSIVESIIKKHRGKIWAESEIDKGTVFYFSVGNLE